MPDVSAPAPAAPPPSNEAPAQTPREAERRYHVEAWSNGYFFINAAGHMAVRPRAGTPAAIDLHDAVAMLRARGVALPAVLRFPGLLHTRVERLQRAFREAVTAAGYGGTYRGVYPVKVNQSRAVVEEILRAGRPYGLGLECGSRAELALALPYVEGEALLVCNGCKDAAMMRLLAGAQRVGKRALPVLERVEEFELLRQAAASAGADAAAPLCFGARVRLSTSGTGLWSESSGAHSKFGLSLAELLALAEALADAPAFSFELIHFHLGSQITDLGSIRAAATEAARLYAALRQRGLPLRLLDVGGGLGVPYEAGPPDAAAVTDAAGGVGYTLGGYARAVVGAVHDVCRAEDVPPPTLISESGRALTAYHAVFVTDVLGARAKAPPGYAPSFSDRGPLAEALRTLRRSPEPLSAEALQDVHARAEAARDEAAWRFRAGNLSLEAKAETERCYGVLCQALGDHAARLGAKARTPALDRLAARCADHYLCNFSVFRSIPDHWALGQRFPIVPLGRHLERPTRRATLVDLTCDSDGAVADFVAPWGRQPFLDLHPLRAGTPYPLGVFLVGAYQDTLGDMHNLFGTPSEVSLCLDAEAPGGFRVATCRPGTRVAEQLADVHYDAEALCSRLGAQAQEAAASGRCAASEADAFCAAYAGALAAGTYLDGSG